MTRRLTQIAFRTAAAYLAVSAAWILLSDSVVERMTSDPHLLRVLQTYKGLVFVGTTTVLLYLYVRRQMGSWDAEVAARQRGGRLTLRTWRRTGPTPGEDPCLADVPEGSWVCLSVADNGCGIPAANLPRLFEPFFTTEEVGKGTGLGLATVYGILQQHGGWIRVTSSPGIGSTFHIGLPATEGPARPASPSRARGALLKGTGTLLVVEDEVPLRRIVEGALRRCGYTVLVAGSGREALAIWERHRDEIDLVLTDMVMPEGMSGGELVDRLRAEKPDLAAIFSSGYSPELVGATGRFREGTDFLQKPFDLDSLSRLVSVRLGQR